MYSCPHSGHFVLSALHAVTSILSTASKSASCLAGLLPLCPLSSPMPSCMSIGPTTQYHKHKTTDGCQFELTTDGCQFELHLKMQYRK